MSKVIQFNNQQSEEQHSCPMCDMIWEFMGYCKEAESEEELFEILSGLTEEAKALGQKELLVSQVNQSMELLDHIYGTCDCDCEYCCEDEE